MEIYYYLLKKLLLIMKKTVLLLMALVMSAGFVFAQSTIPASNNVKGVHVSAKLDPTDDNQWTGANIILGSDAAVWPWSTGGDDGVAFTPVQGATYHLTFNVTSSGTEGFRVRWLSDDTNGGYTAGDGAVVTSQSPW
ncbi:MAG: hypothetical protein FWF52_05175, partial [Candidatus Azobacteroides sp.]|nr:hypothetical protein [Candidatus Azobacteroides sp.]